MRRPFSVRCPMRRQNLIALIISFNCAAVGASAQTFTPGVTKSLTCGTNPRCVATADFNGYGHADVAVANYGTGLSVGSVNILLGDGVMMYCLQKAALRY